MRRRNQDTFSVIGNSIKMIGLAALLFMLKYVFAGVMIIATLFGILFFIKQIFNNK